MNPKVGIIICIISTILVAIGVLWLLGGLEVPV